MEQKSDKMQQSVERTAQTMGNTLVEVLDRLAGKKSDVRLRFEDLSLDTGAFKATMSGAIVFEATMAEEPNEQRSTAGTVTVIPSG